MQFYKNARNIERSETKKAKLKTLDSNSFELKLINMNLSDNNIEDITFTYIFNKDTFLKDQKLKTLMTGAHIVSAIYPHESDETRLNAIDFFKHSKHNKGNIGSIRLALDIAPIMFGFIPFSDSPSSDYIVVVNLNDVTLDEEELEPLNLDNDVHISELANQMLPNIALNKNGNEITAQLSVAKEGIEIYFETTTGYLNKTRALTDATGKATVKVFGDELEGKVKAGFKHFSGKAEINI